METVLFKGTPCHTCGTVPGIGETAPCYHLTAPDLSQILCSDFADKRVVLNIFPSLDTPVCATSLLLQGFQCCGVVGLAGDFVDEVAVDDAAVFVEDEDASGEEPCEGSVNEL